MEKVKNMTITFSFVVLIVTLLMAVSYAQRGHGVGRMMYNPNNETKIRGNVLSKELWGMMGAIKVQTKGGVVTVKLAPTWYLQAKNINLNVNDNVVVTGYKDYWTGTLMVARRIKVNDKVIRLRNKRGVPRWARGKWRSKGRYHHDYGYCPYYQKKRK